MDKITDGYCFVASSERELLELYAMVEFSLQELDFDHVFSVDERKQFFNSGQIAAEHLVEEIKSFKGGVFRIAKDDIKPILKLLNQIGLEHKKPDGITWGDYDKVWLEIGKIRDVIFPGQIN